MGALDGTLVVSVEQAVAAPYCSVRLADAGARVIKIERPEGDFARNYDTAVNGESAYFVWLNRGKQSVALDFKQPQDMALLQRLALQGRRVHPEPGAGRGRARGLRLGSLAQGQSAADHRRHHRLRRFRAVSPSPRLRSSGAGRKRHGLDHRHARRARPHRRIGDRCRLRHVCPCGGAGGVARAASHRRRSRHRSVAVLGHGRVDDRAAAAPRL